MPSGRSGVVEVIIRAKDATANVIARFRRNWRSLERTVRQVTRAVAAFTAAGTAAVVGLTKLAQQGDKVIAVKRTFARITDDETAALNRLREAAGGTISDFQLMANHNQALALGAARSTEEFAKMVEISRALGRAQGIDAAEALEKFTVGMARQSKLRLDDLGITLTQTEANRRYAEQLGKSVDALTDAEKATAFRNEALRRGEELVQRLAATEDVGAQAAGRFAAQMVNLRDKLAEFTAQSPLVEEFFNKLSLIAEGLVSAFADDIDRLKEGFSIIGSYLGDAFAAAFLDAVSAALDKADRALLPGFLEDRITTPLGIWSGALKGFADDAREAAAAWEQALISFSKRPPPPPGGGEGGGGGGGGGGAGALALPPVTGRSGGPLPPSRYYNPAALARYSARRQAEREANAARVGYQTGGLTPIASPERIRETSEAMNEAGQVAVAAFGSAAAAAINGSSKISESVIRMITDIARSLPGVGGLFGSIIGAAGGIFGAIIGSNRDRRVPVSLQEVTPEAADQMRKGGPPLRVTTIIEQGGVEIERIEREFADRTRRDEVVRYGGAGLAISSE